MYLGGTTLPAGLAGGLEALPGPATRAPPSHRRGLKIGARPGVNLALRRQNEAPPAAPL